MNDLLPLATVSLVNFLSAHLPGLSDDWWTKHVVDRLSFQQQRMVQEHGLTSLDRLDLAALLPGMAKAEVKWTPCLGHGVPLY